MVFLLFALLFLTNILGSFSGKAVSRSFPIDTDAAYPMLLMLNAVIACVFFFCGSGFHPVCNLPSAEYAVMYGLLVIVSLLISVFLYRYVTVGGAVVFGSAGNLIVTSLAGYAFLHETVSLASLVRLALMVAAAVLIYFGERKKGREEKKRRSFVGMLLLLASLSVGCLVTLVSKSYASNAAVVDDNSFFFYTNVFLLVIGMLWNGIVSLRNRSPYFSCLKALKKKNYLFICGNTVISNTSSLLTLAVLVLVDVSVFSPLSAALGILAGAVVSWIIREKLYLPTYAAILLAVIAVVIPV